MRPSVAAIVLGLGLLAGPPSFAAGPSSGPQPSARAPESSALPQNIWTRVAVEELASAERLMTRIMGKLSDKLDPAGRKRLIEAQTAWASYREAQAAFAADHARGGSAASSLANECRTELTRARIRELSLWLELNSGAR